MCGVLALFDIEEVVSKIYTSLLTLQHRGQDAAGILTYDGKFHLKKGNGLVRDIFDQNNISRLKGQIGIAHTRYPTIGGGSVEDAQPFSLNSPYGLAIVHNGNITNFNELKRELWENSKKLINSNCDVEIILNVFANYLEKNNRKPLSPELLFNAVRHVYRKVKGAYSVVIYIAEQGMLAFRDPHGIRSLLFGINDQKMLPVFGFASESVALDVLNFKTIEDIPPGSAVFIDQQRRVFRKKIYSRAFRPCIFEYIYFARPDSTMNGINVYHSRVLLGQKLAEKIKNLKLQIDVVVPVPDSARTAAIEIARRLHLKYREGLVKNRYIGRTFIMPEHADRFHNVRQKLNPIPSIFKDQNVLLVDDSIVRGTTSRSIIQMVRNCGARKIYFASCSAPLTNPCVYGIDMQTRQEFIAANLPLEQIALKIGADEVIYQDLQAMEQAVRHQNRKIKEFCKACFCGHYPTGDVSPAILSEIENERQIFKNQLELAIRG